MAGRRKPTLEEVLDTPEAGPVVPGADVYGPLPPKIEHPERSYFSKYAKQRQLVNQSLGLAQVLINQARIEQKLDRILAKLGE